MGGEFEEEWRHACVWVPLLLLPETVPALLIGYAQYKIKKFFYKRKQEDWRHCLCYATICSVEENVSAQLCNFSVGSICVEKEKHETNFNNILIQVYQILSFQPIIIIKS